MHEKCGERIYELWAKWNWKGRSLKVFEYIECRKAIGIDGITAGKLIYREATSDWMYICYLVWKKGRTPENKT